VLIGNNDPTFEATYKLLYSPDSGACSFSLQDGNLTYTYICEVLTEAESGKPKIRILRIITTETLVAGQRRSSCEDGEEFVLSR